MSRGGDERFRGASYRRAGDALAGDGRADGGGVWVSRGVHARVENLQGVRARFPVRGRLGGAREFVRVGSSGVDERSEIELRGHRGAEVAGGGEASEGRDGGAAGENGVGAVAGVEEDGAELAGGAGGDDARAGLLPLARLGQEGGCGGARQVVALAHGGDGRDGDVLHRESRALVLVVERDVPQEERGVTSRHRLVRRAEGAEQAIHVVLDVLGIGHEARHGRRLRGLLVLPLGPAAGVRRTALLLLRHRRARPAAIRSDAEGGARASFGLDLATITFRDGPTKFAGDASRVRPEKPPCRFYPDADDALDAARGDAPHVPDANATHHVLRRPRAGRGARARRPGGPPGSASPAPRRRPRPSPRSRVSRQRGDRRGGGRPPRGLKRLPRRHDGHRQVFRRQEARRLPRVQLLRHVRLPVLVPVPGPAVPDPPYPPRRFPDSPVPLPNPAVTRSSSR